MRLTALLATTTRWFPTARLAMALADAGFTVEAVCPADHPIHLTGAAGRLYKYHGLRAIRSFSSAIELSKPDLIIPGDDLATRHLHQLHRENLLRGAEGAAICARIERSLGAPQSFPAVSARTALMKIAREEGVRVPETEVMLDENALAAFCKAGFPVVLKADGSSGGEGVRVVGTPEEAQRAFHTLGNPPLLARAAKRTLLDGDSTLLQASLFRRRAVVNAQAFVPGREATSAVACWDGKVLASLQFEVVKKAKSTGHATVLRAIDNQDMSHAAERMVARLGLSGLHGFDFMIDVGTERAHLIEMNPRATQIGHFTLGYRRDLAAALYAAVSGEPVRTVPKMTEKDTIALFPNEWLRDSASRFLRQGYHDVPWQEPRLVRACILSRRRKRAWYAPKVAAHLQRKQIHSGD